MRTYSFITHIAGWILFLSLPILFVGNQSGGSDFWSILFSWNALLFFTTYVLIFYVNSYFLIPQLYAKKKWLLYALSLLVLLAAVWALRPYDNLINKRENRFTGNSNQLPPMERFDPPGRPFHTPKGNELDEPPPQPPDPPDNHDASHVPHRKPPEHGGPGGHNTPFLDIISIFLFIIIMVFSLALNFLSRLRFAEQRALQADTDKANAELSFLKAQINPHF